MKNINAGEMISGAGSMAATGFAIGGPIGAAAGGVIGLAKEFIAAGQRTAAIEQQRIENYRNELNTVASNYYQKLSSGGVVRGPGTPTSDSIKTKLNPGDVIIPAKYGKMATDIGNSYLGWKDKKAKVGGSSNVAISNGEVLFTSREVKLLKSYGIDIEDLIE